MKHQNWLTSRGISRRSRFDQFHPAGELLLFQAQLGSIQILRQISPGIQLSPVPGLGKMSLVIGVREIRLTGMRFRFIRGAGF